MHVGTNRATRGTKVSLCDAVGAQKTWPANATSGPKTVNAIRDYGEGSIRWSSLCCTASYVKYEEQKQDRKCYFYYSNSPKMNQAFVKCLAGAL